MDRQSVHYTAIKTGHHRTSGFRFEMTTQDQVISSSDCSSVTTHSHFPCSCVPRELQSSDFRRSEGCPCHVCLTKKVCQEHKMLPDCLSVVLVLAFDAEWLSIRVGEERRTRWKILFKDQSYDGHCSETCARNHSVKEKYKHKHNNLKNKQWRRSQEDRTPKEKKVCVQSWVGTQSMKNECHHSAVFPIH